MKIYLTDIMGKCCPTDVDTGKENARLTGRVKAQVMDRIGAERPRRGRKIVRTALLIAAALALFTCTAYAVTEFFMQRTEVEETQLGYWREVDKNGELLFEQKLSYPDAGMVLTFKGPEEKYNRPEFRAFWLPSKANSGHTDEEGWSSYLSGAGKGLKQPYLIEASNVNTGEYRYVLSGKPTVVKEEYWDEWYVLEISSDYSECTQRWFYENDRANYILLFDKLRGYLVSVKGTESMETLEHIARELEIRESEYPAYEAPEGHIAEIGMIDLGRG